MSEKKILIIQTSPYHTASTFLINALYGFVPCLLKKPILGIWDKDWENQVDDIIIIKCHNTNIDELISTYSNKYNLYFLCSERPDSNLILDPKYKLYDNVIMFQYSELNETDVNTLPDIIHTIYNRIKNTINIELNIENAIQRIEDMNKRYEEIKNEPFAYIDQFFELHGSHRYRKNHTYKW